jgi:hypothetical protein
MWDEMNTIISSAVVSDRSWILESMYLMFCRDSVRDVVKGLA